MPAKRDPQALCAYLADRVFDGRRVVPHQAVLVENRRVVCVLPARELTAGTPIAAYPGCTILPGLVDIHTHFMRWQGPLYLAHGVTTVRDTGNPLNWILARRSEWEKRQWPRIFCTGPLIDGPSPVHPVTSRPCTNISDAIRGVREVAAAGVDGIKLYVGLETGWIPAMVREANSAGLPVSQHCLQTGMLLSARAGVQEFFHLDGILHDIWPDHPPGWLDAWGLPGFEQTLDRQKYLADEIAEREIVMTPTLAYWDSQWRGRLRAYKRHPALRDVPREVIDWQVPGEPDREGSARWKRALKAARRFVALLREREVTVLAGTDTPCGAAPPGLSLWREMRLLVEAGMNTREVLTAATSATGKIPGFQRVGALCREAAADLVVVRGNPLDAIPDPPDIVLVVRNGEEFDPAAPKSRAETVDLSDEPWARQFQAHAEHTPATPWE